MFRKQQRVKELEEYFKIPTQDKKVQDHVAKESKILHQKSQ